MALDFQMAGFVENLVMGVIVLATLGYAICVLALLGQRNRRTSAPRLLINSFALFDPRNFRAGARRWHRRLKWILLIVAVTLISSAPLLTCAGSIEHEIGFSR